jgi:hypothetical protein
MPVANNGTAAASDRSTDENHQQRCRTAEPYSKAVAQNAAERPADKAANSDNNSERNSDMTGL